MSRPGAYGQTGGKIIALQFDDDWHSVLPKGHFVKSAWASGLALPADLVAGLGMGEVAMFACPGTTLTAQRETNPSPEMADRYDRT